MDPYEILGVPRGCSREQVKQAFRSRVRRAHPDRGGDGAAFIELCAAYRRLLGESDPEGDPIEEPATTGRRGAAASVDPRATRRDYVTWLERVSAGRARRRRMRWWDRHPRLAKAGLLGAIGVLGVLVLCAAAALGIRSSKPDSRRGTFHRPAAVAPIRPAGRESPATGRAVSTPERAGAPPGPTRTGRSAAGRS